MLSDGLICRSAIEIATYMSDAAQCAPAARVDRHDHAVCAEQTNPMILDGFSI